MIPEPIPALIYWRDAGHTKPPPDERVLGVLVGRDGTREVYEVEFSGGQWWHYECEVAGHISEQVTLWAPWPSPPP